MLFLVRQCMQLCIRFHYECNFDFFWFGNKFSLFGTPTAPSEKVHIRKFIIFSCLLLANYFNNFGWIRIRGLTSEIGTVNKYNFIDINAQTISFFKIKSILNTFSTSYAFLIKCVKHQTLRIYLKVDKIYSHISMTK